METSRILPDSGVDWETTRGRTLGGLPWFPGKEAILRGRRQEAGDRRQDTGGKIQEAGYRRQEAICRRKGESDLLH